MSLCNLKVYEVPLCNGQGIRARRENQGLKTCLALLQPKRTLPNILLSKESRSLNARRGNSGKKSKGKGSLKTSEMMLNLTFKKMATILQLNECILKRAMKRVVFKCQLQDIFIAY